MLSVFIRTFCSNQPSINKIYQDFSINSLNLKNKNHFWKNKDKIKEINCKDFENIEKFCCLIRLNSKLWDNCMRNWAVEFWKSCPFYKFFEDFPCPKIF